MNIIEDTIDLFNVVVSNSITTDVKINFAHSGFVTNFIPTQNQEEILKSKFQPLDYKTLFSVEEREGSNFYNLIEKQILHYIETYTLDSPGFFNLRLNSGQIATLNFVKGVTTSELSNLVCDLLYSNRPVKDSEQVRRIIKEYSIQFDINLVQNNELRVILFNQNVMKYQTGDDAVRYICYKATDSALLIKSPEVLLGLKNKNISAKFLEDHEFVLSQVFNRHKKIIMACKNSKTKSVINKISRLSKRNHVPVFESFSKTLISSYMNDTLVGDITQLLSKVSLKDKFKFLNLLEYKKKQSSTDTFVIRNGKMRVEQNRPLFEVTKCNDLISLILDSISLEHLRDKKILLDRNVDYGLPISRKQTLGKLPFGTKITVDGNSISSGVYWENNWGARDLDLSAIDIDGNRVGWGSSSGYSDKDIVFSGDLTDATDGAMEFMTSDIHKPIVYGLFMNVYSGETPCEYEIVVGSKTDRRWIKSPIVREKVALSSKSCLTGFISGGQFIVFSGKTGSSEISGSLKEKSIIAKGSAKMWTVKELLIFYGIEYSTDSQDTNYEHDLSYNSFSYDKLESLLFE